MPVLTIYTATYNRAPLLPRLYASLCRQTNQDFLWLVIDDGSTDQTRVLIESWKNNAPFEIRYYYKKNEGVHSARNLSHHLCDTELLMAVDSDDWLVDQAVEKMLSLWYEKGGEDYLGVLGMAARPDGQLVTKFPEDDRVKAASAQDLLYRYGCNRDMVSFERAAIWHQIPDAPVFPSEKLVGESYFNIQLPQNKLYLLLREPIKIIEYQEAGLSSAAYENMFRNPRGFREDYRQHILHAAYWKGRIKGYIGYIACSILLKDRHFVGNAPKSLATALLTPLGALGLLYLICRRNAVRRRRN